MDTASRAAAIPKDTSKFGWQRRFTSLVQSFIAESGRDGAKPMLPKDAGDRARASVIAEFRQSFPNEPLPSFPPFQS